MIRTCLSALVAIALTGCTSTKEPNVDPALTQLNQAAESILMHSKRLSDVEAAKYIDAGGKPAGAIDTSLFPELEKVVSLGSDWHGPLDELVARLSTFTDFRVRELGKKPAGDVMVSVNAQYRRIIDMLYDAGVQAGSRAHVRVLGDEKVLEVEYVTY